MKNVAVGVVLVRDGRVLLGLRQGGPGEGMWGTPGGRVDEGEHPLAAAARELEEETGLRAVELRPLTWTMTEPTELGGEPWLVLHVLVRADGEPQLREPHKCAEWRFADWSDPPAPLFHGAQKLKDSGFPVPGVRL